MKRRPPPGGLKAFPNLKCIVSIGAGVDHILWDYIRRPDGDLKKMVIPGLETTPEKTSETPATPATPASAPQQRTDLQRGSR